MVTTASIRLARKQAQAAEEIISESGRQIAMLAEVPGAAPGIQRQFQELAREVDGVATAVLDFYPVMMKRLWEQLNAGFEAVTIGNPRAAVGSVLELFRSNLATMQELRAEVDQLERHGGRFTSTGDLDRAIGTAQNMVDEVARLLAWLNEPVAPADPATLEASRKAYDAGDYQELGEMIRGLQGDCHPTR